MKLGVIGCKRSLNVKIGDDCEAISKKAGFNFGNLLFQHACVRLIEGDFLGIGINSSWDVQEIKSHCDKIVFPSANFINEESDFGSLADFLEKLDLPIVSIGLGAQNGLDGKKEIRLKDGTRRLIDLLSERSECIGVRGEYTQSILEDMGITNTQIIGCPSNLLNESEELEKSFKAKLARETTFLTVNGHHPWTDDPELRELEEFFFQLAYSQDADYLAQSHEPLIKLASRAKYCPLEEWFEIASSLHRASGLSISKKAFEKFVVSRLYYEIDVPSWLQRSSFYDFSIGLRLHGNMIAFQAGTPSLWVAHDSRTLELIKTMCLPHISWSDLKETKVADYRDIFSNQIGSYFQRRRFLIDNFTEFLWKNQLVPRITIT